MTTPAPDPAQGSATEGEGEDVEHPYFEKAAAIQGWEEFYRWANRTYGNPELFARLTLHRLSGEIGLSKDQVKTVLRTLRAEREAAERAVLQAYDKEKLKLIFECPDEDQAAYGEIWKGLGGILDRVHRDSGAALESGFTPEQRAAIDEHLRNQNLGLCHEYNRDSFGRNLGGDRFWVVGVGRVRGGRGFAGPSEQETEIEVLALPAVFRR